MRGGDGMANQWAAGCDISEWQGYQRGTTVDWSRLAQSGQVDFVMVRATYGAVYPDHDFANNWPASRRVGLVRGPYHFGVPGGSDAAAITRSATGQAAFFSEAISAAGGLYADDLPPMVEVDQQNGLNAAEVVLWARTFCAAVDARVGDPAQRCGIYSNLAFYQTYLANDAELAARPLWIAAYRADPPPVNWWMWQRTDAGSLPGIEGPVDLDVLPTDRLPRQPVSRPGYWLAGADGGVFSFGAAPFWGSLPERGIAVDNIVGMAATKDGQGYWLVGADGGVFSFGTAPFYGSLPGLRIRVNNIVGMAATPTGRGYWLVGADGGVFAFGDAVFSGSLPGQGVVVGNIRAIAVF